jgi:hypothetical protein
MNMDNYASENVMMIDKRKFTMEDLTSRVLVTINAKLPRGWHDETFKKTTRVAKDSGGFKLLQEPQLAESFSVDRLIDEHNRIGYGANDIIVSADFPVPNDAGLPSREVRARQVTSVDWYEQMKEKIPQTVPVLHGRTTREIEAHMEMYGETEMVCVGSNLALGTPSNVVGRLGQGKKRGEASQVVSKENLWKRIIETMKILDDRDVFLLGAGGMNAAPIAALLGATAVDATSWRVNAMLKQVFATDYGRFIKVGSRNDNMDKLWAQDFLESRTTDESYPFFGMNLKGLQRLLRTSNDARSVHNLWESQNDATRVSEFESDPEGLHQMLKQRFTSSGWSDWKNLKLLDKAIEARRSVKPIENFAKA